MKSRSIARISTLSRANAIVFISSFCVMVIELIAARILAPHIGVSLYTWTSIIGTILASIALGNYVGGRIADRYGSHLVLVAIFFAGGLATIGILPATRVITEGNWFSSLPPMLNFTLKTSGIFFLPAFVLSMVSPVVIKLTLADLGRTGGVVGTIYAVSTAGAILGTYLTGFYLIVWFGLSMIVWLVCLVLNLTGILAWVSWKLPGDGTSWRRNLIFWTATTAVFVAGISLFQMRDRWQETYTRESNYYSIQVRDISSNAKALFLDHLAHTYILPDQPAAILSPYLEVFAEVVRYTNPGGRPLTSLHLGGGGYSFPRYLEAVYGGENEVVEIDPAVTEVAHAWLGLPPDTRIRTYHLDARQFLNSRAAGPGYDLVVGDVFNDYATPYHLTTLEFDGLVRANLARDGVYLINIIDNYPRGRFMASMIRTLRATFRNVYAFSSQPWWDYDAPATYVLAATDRSLDLADFSRFATRGGAKTAVAYPHDEAALVNYIARQRALLLTDEYAPTDVLLAQIQRSP